MSIGTLFDTMKMGAQDMFSGVKGFYEPGKLGTKTKLTLTIVAIVAIFYVVGTLCTVDHDE